MLHARGPLLTVDVSARTATETAIDELLETSVGGRAVATALAHERIPFDADPYGAENRVYLSTGPLQQSRMSFTGRMNMTGLSPLTDGLVSSNAGGYLSRNVVGTGLSVLELVGSSDELLAIHVTDGADESRSSGSETPSRPRVEFEAVPGLEGATVPETSDYVAQTRDLGPDNCIAIGPAGENLVRFASVMTFDSRAFGRGGLGAVLGSKNVKCVTFEGDSAPPVEISDDPAMDVHREAAQSDDRMRRQGTTGSTEFINDAFSLPTRYFAEYEFEHAAAIGGDAVEEKKYKKGACSACAYACKLPTRDEETGVETEGPEFETVYAFGSQQGVGDIVDVMRANELCDALGMDTISAGVTVAAYLASVDEFGNAELARELTERIAYRDGVGDALAEGVERCHYDLGVENYTVKGLEFAAHDGRVLHGQGLSYAVANRGADHLYASMLSLEYNGDLDPEGTLGKSETLVERENLKGFIDSGIVCVFGRDYVTDRLEALFDAEYEELLDVGARTVLLERDFNARRGFDRSDDGLPYGLPDLEAAIAEYYEVRGLADDGSVPAETLESIEPVAPSAD
ncbi:aldehyde ferredoxin oxidoreductase C-terminal domain-containing protein [Natrialbaceae archaeon GCM10025810]|uniref:aldehyde ferredoxin oxidoreductase C-terminal domain-containing protein n=1 Tax=Halovalidus salilacus TaxID=3075124 RepID=UPI003610821C